MVSSIITQKLSEAIQQAAEQVIAGDFDNQFVVDTFQTGSGTSTNMNANEVSANRAIEIPGGTRGDKSVHPNDHVNCGQSSNDVIATAIHIAALDGIHHYLIPALTKLHGALLQLASIELREEKKADQENRAGGSRDQGAIPSGFFRFEIEVAEKLA